jgi:hypothetical protein
MNLDKIDLKNIHKIVGEMVGDIQQKEMEGKTPDEFARERGFSDWLEYAAWSRHTGGDYQMMEYALKAKWKEQDPEEFARQKKIETDQRVREHSYIGVLTTPTKKNKKRYESVHKSNFTADQLEEMYKERGVSGEPVEYRW